MIDRIRPVGVLLTASMALSACGAGQVNLPRRCVVPSASAEASPSIAPEEHKTLDARLKADAKRLLDIRDSYGQGVEYVGSEVLGLSRKEPGELVINTSSITLVFSVPVGDPLLEKVYLKQTPEKPDVDRTQLKWILLRNDDYRDTMLVADQGEWFMGRTPHPGDYSGSTLEAYARNNFTKATAEDKTKFAESVKKTISDLDEYLKKNDNSSCDLPS